MSKKSSEKVPKKRVNKTDRLLIIRLEVRKKGISGINRKRLCDLFGISPRTLYKDIKHLTNNVPPEEIVEIGFELKEFYIDLIIKLRNALKKATSAKDITMLSNSLDKAMQGITKSLEAWKYKETIAKKTETLNVDVDLTPERVRELYELAKSRDLIDGP